MNKKHGQWEKRYRYANIWHFRCSECKKTSAHSSDEKPIYLFCPHCSAVMSEVKKND